MTKTTMSCRVCHAGDVSVFTETPGILTCGNCLSGFRGTSSRKTDYSRKIAMPDPLSTELRNRHHYAFIAKNAGFANIRRILEIGSGHGALIRYIRARHRDIEIVAIEPGWDFCADLVRIGSVRVINDYIENVQLTGKFDLVIMSHVLEHLEDPVRALRHVHDRFLKEHGVLFIDVPTREYELKNEDTAQVAPESHLVFFDSAGLRKVLANVGFAAEATTGTKYASLPDGYVRRMEKIGRMKRMKQVGPSLLAMKLMNRISLLAMNLYRTAFAVAPRETGLDEIDHRCNNMALAVRK